jgi:hypothetical protein
MSEPVAFGAGAISRKLPKPYKRSSLDTNRLPPAEGAYAPGHLVRLRQAGKSDAREVRRSPGIECFLSFINGCAHLVPVLRGEQAVVHQPSDNFEERLLRLDVPLAYLVDLVLCHGLGPYRQQGMSAR